MRVSDLFCCVSALVLWAAVPVHAQEESGESVDSITVRGEVLSTFDGHPVPGVLVTLHDLWRITRTDELGYFEIPNVPVGPHELGVYALGYETLEQYIEFVPDEVLAVKLDAAPIQIEGVQVEVLGNTVLEYRSFGTRYDFIGGDLLGMGIIRAQRRQHSRRSQPTQGELRSPIQKRSAVDHAMDVVVK